MSTKIKKIVCILVAIPIIGYILEFIYNLGIQIGKFMKIFTYFIDFC